MKAGCYFWRRESLGPVVITSIDGDVCQFFCPISIQDYLGYHRKVMDSIPERAFNPLLSVTNLQSFFISDPIRPADACDRRPCDTILYDAVENAGALTPLPVEGRSRKIV